MARGQRGRVSKGPEWGAIAVLGVVLSGAAILGYVYWRASREHVDIDSESLCPTNQEPSAYFAIVLDASDPFNEIQRTAIKRELDDLWTRVPGHGEVRVFGLAVDDATPATEVFRVCNPGSGEGADPIMQNPARLQKRFEEYLKKLERGEREWLRKEGTKVSPIMEALQAVALSFPVRTGKPRSVILVSDLLQHSSRFSLYGGRLPEFADFERSQSYSRLMADVRGATIEVLFVGRDGALEAELQRGSRLVRFWEQYFTSLGASVARVKRIEG